jgi:hypothetical protein
MSGDVDILIVEIVWCVLVGLVAGTFAPPLQQHLPWGRAYAAWRRRRIAAGVRELLARERQLEATEHAPAALGYRDAAPSRSTAPKPSWLERRRAERRARERLALESRVDELG